MVNARSLRANPRPSWKGATLTSVTRLGVTSGSYASDTLERRRARSVPINLAAEPESLPSAVARSLKRKRTAQKATAEHNMSPGLATQATAGSSKIPSAVPVAGSEKKGIGLLTPAPSQSPFTSGPDSHRRERAASSRKDKGKQKAHAGDVVEYTSDNEAAGSHSTPVSGRPTKRRRVDRPEDDTTNTNGAIQAPTWLESLLGPQERSQPDDDAHADAELDASFHLLDIADITALPNVPVDPAIHRESAELPANETLYVPPAVGRILETMHRALATERRARQRAEALYTFEHTRRQKLEDIAVTLRQKNAVLEVEARAWAARTALSASDPSAFAALRLTVDGEQPAAMGADGQPVDVWSLPQIHPPPAGTPSPSFTLVVARQADPGTRRTQGVSADTTASYLNAQESS